MKLVIDTDPGIDDAMAIFYAAAAPEIDLIGLTTVFGNVTTPIATRNALRLVEAAGLNIPVAAGADQPLMLPPFPPSSQVHGDQGFGAIPAADPRGTPDAQNAVDFLSQVTREHPGEITVCAIGPLTNIAMVLQKDPDFTRNVSQIVIMGGSIEEGGNITPDAEANIYHDPHAADVVMASGANVVLVGLDVTHMILCTPRDFAAIADRAPRLGGMLGDMAEFYLAFYKSVGKFDGCSLHDPAAVIACTHPELFDIRDMVISVDCEGSTAGRTITAQNLDRSAIQVCMDVKSDAVKQLFLDRLALLD
ncbi:nucleoside hydrolase [Aliisedimentitalea scapharcae]|uniref:Nucleoside hydrolase n=1 Tax=Aliisedimentitalea scapharcae TaxID=1524259 RepID=A0ABZ2XUD7_9RHOB